VTIAFCQIVFNKNLSVYLSIYLRTKFRQNWVKNVDGRNVHMNSHWSRFVFEALHDSLSNQGHKQAENNS